MYSSKVKEAHGTQKQKYYSYDGRNRNDGVDTLIDEFIRECEREAAKLEVTVDYYLAEFA